MSKQSFTYLLANANMSIIGLNTQQLNIGFHHLHSASVSYHIKSWACILISVLWVGIDEGYGSLSLHSLYCLHILLLDHLLTMLAVGF